MTTEVTYGTTTVHNTSWLQPWPFGDFAHQLMKATLQQYVVEVCKKDSPRSSVVTLQGVASPQLPIGCCRELNGLSLYREQGTMSDVLRKMQGERAKRPPLPSHLGSRRNQGCLQNFKKSVARISMTSAPPIPILATSKKCNQGCRHPHQEHHEDQHEYKKWACHYPG